MVCAAITQGARPIEVVLVLGREFSVDANGLVPGCDIYARLTTLSAPPNCLPVTRRYWSDWTASSPSLSASIGN